MALPLHITTVLKQWNLLLGNPPPLLYSSQKTDSYGELDLVSGDCLHSHHTMTDKTIFQPFWINCLIFIVPRTEELLLIQPGKSAKNDGKTFQHLNEKYHTYTILYLNTGYSN